MNTVGCNVICYVKLEAIFETVWTQNSGLSHVEQSDQVPQRSSFSEIIYCESI